MNANKITTTKISLTKLPAGLADSLKAAGVTRRNVKLNVIHDDSFTVYVSDLRWGGGTRCEYGTYIAKNEHLIPSIGDVKEGDRVSVQPGAVMVVQSVFCGKECDPAVYVRNVELAAFYGVQLPEEFKDMPAAIVADWMNEQADEKGSGRAAKKEAKALRAAADLIRELAGLVAA